MVLKKLCSYLVILVLLLSGCSNSSANKEDESQMSAASPVEAFNESIEGVLSETAMVKFDESFESQEERRYVGLGDLSVFYEPAFVKEGITFEGIAWLGWNGFSFLYRNETGRRVLFEWDRGSSRVDIAVTDMFNRGAVAEYIEEHNGITYGITEWMRNNKTEFDGYGLGWAQYGQRFSVAVSEDFTLQEALDFAYAVPITSFELDGDAVSVSIQGMDNVGVIDGEGMEIIAEDDVLYRVDGAGGAGSGGMERIGYRWLTDEGAGRYQYVLEPGEYQFSAVGGGSGAELLVKHFETGDCVSSADYTQTVAGQAGSRFILTVSGDPGETAIDFTDEGINPK